MSWLEEAAADKAFVTGGMGFLTGGQVYGRAISSVCLQRSECTLGRKGLLAL